MTETIQIYVSLLNEGTPCWRPVDARHVGDDLYLIPEETEVPEDETWQFGPGSTVYCSEKEMTEGTYLVAEKELNK